VTIHDLIFLRYPQWYRAADRKIYERKFSHACREADVVVAVSEQTKRDIIDCFGTPENKVKVVYQSCGEEFHPGIDSKSVNAFLHQRGLPDRYLLYVGTIEERKNLLTLVKALQQVRDVDLVVVGKKKKYFEKVRQFIEANGMQDRVFFPDGITSSELPMAYRAASALVYPSYYEGFGIPVLEALRSGTPVIASSRSALPEAGGPTSLYFNPEDYEELAGKIRQVLDDQALREKMIGDGVKYALRFHPQQTSADLMTVYQSLSR
jgi:glycosyltransferase involved in cell wall biosynthesis